MSAAARLRRRLRSTVTEAHVLRRRASLPVRSRALALRAHRRAAGGYQVLVAPPGSGNIGDQAMVEAFLARATGRVVLVQREVGDIVVPAALAAEVETLALPDLIFGEGASRAADLDAYLHTVARADSVAVIGADMVDGAYTLRGSVHRLLLAELAALAGVPTRILGFSWSPRARPAALRALRHAAEAGAVPVLRDPDSAARVRAAHVPQVVDGSDIVFTARDLDRSAVPQLDRAAPYAVVNVSALVRRSVPAEAYVPVVQHLRDAGLAVVLLPHVLRGSSDDLTACREVHDLVRGPGVHLVERALAPATVRGLAADAALVVTGRMHLAIMAMNAGVPAVTFSTQGKVSGLMALLGVPRLCVEPGPELAPKVAALVDEIRADDGLRRTIAEHLPAVRALAEENFRPRPVLALQDGARVAEPRA